MAERIESFADLQKLKQEYDATVKMIDSLVSKIEHFNTVASKSGKGIGKSSNTKQVNDEMAKQDKLLRDITHSSTALYKETTKLDQVKKEYVRITRLEVQANNKELGSYKQLQAQIGLASKKYKDLAASQGMNHKATKQALADLNRMQGKLNRVDRAMGNFRHNVGNYGKRIAGSFKRMGSSLLAFFSIRYISQFLKSSMQAAREQDQVFAKLTAVIKTTGGAAGYTAKEMANMASALQNVTVYGDEADRKSVV